MEEARLVKRWLSVQEQKGATVFSGSGKKRDRENASSQSSSTRRSGAEVIDVILSEKVRTTYDILNN